MRQEDDNLAELSVSTKPLLAAGKMSHPEASYSKIPMFNYNSIPEIKALKRKL